MQSRPQSEMTTFSYILILVKAVNLFHELQLEKTIFFYFVNSNSEIYIMEHKLQGCLYYGQKVQGHSYYRQNIQGHLYYGHKVKEYL